ncbi:DUF6531 domain-containing protein [Streptomyces sp. MSC1_001]|jgi:RHS repeat-associated protein|uniref:DUF6531 domain-containing protein n=1 Tax=Streptomyces sp. MSC1_001 TaxID=2909263 RepID=UPI00202EDFD0|nr:DUF6531 domain-containing protein [Streptomyces sp. MSC1_001]
MAVTVPDWADTLLDLVGVNWPNVDEDAYREMADALREFADDLADDGQLANNHMERLLSSGHGEAMDALNAHWSKVKGTHLKDMVSAARTIAGALDMAAGAIEGMKWKAVAELGILAGQTGLAMALIPVTGGLSALLGAGAIAFTKKQLLKLITGAMEEAVGHIVGVMTEPAVAALENMAADLVVQVSMDALGVQNGVNLDQTKQAGKDGFDQGVQGAKEGLNLASAGSGGRPGGKGFHIEHDEHDSAGTKLNGVSAGIHGKTAGKLTKAKAAQGRNKGRDDIANALDPVIEKAMSALVKSATTMGDHVGKTLPMAVKQISVDHKNNDDDLRDRFARQRQGVHDNDSGGKGGGPRRDRDDSVGTRPNSLRGAKDDPRRNSIPLQGKTCKNDPIDVATGEMTLPQTDLSLPGTLPLVLSRTHLSEYRYGHWFGRSWASTLDERLETDPIGGGIIWAREDGSLLVYPRVPGPGDEAVLPLEGPRLPLVHGDEANGRTTFHIADTDSGITRFFTGSPYDASTAYWLGEIQDRHGNGITFSRRSDGMPIAASHDAGYQARISCARGRVTELALNAPGGLKTVLSYGYDDEGNLTDVVNSSSRALRFAYDAHGRITAWTDRNGSTFTYVYDTAGRVIRTVGPDGYLSSRFAYDTERRITRYTDSTGATTTFHLNDRLQVVTITDPLGHTTHAEFDAHDRLLSATDALGHTSRLSYDTAGRPVELLRADGRRTTVAYNDLGLPATLTEPDGAIWHHTYDAEGNRVALTDPAGATTRYTYDGRGAVTSVCDAVGLSTQISRSAAGLPLTVTDPAGRATTHVYDAFGRLTEVVDPLGGTSRFTWSVEGMLTSRTGPKGDVERWTFDGEDNCTTHTDALGNITRYEYGVFDLPTARVTPDGTRYSYHHDTELRLTRVVDPRGLSWTYTYDAAGRLVRETDFDGRAVHYDYDAADQLTTRTNAAGQTVHYRYDSVGDLVAKDIDGRTATYDNDPCGRLIRAVSPDSTLELGYDPAGRLVREHVDGRTLTTHSDATGRRTLRTTPSGAVTAYHYDATTGHRTGLDAAGHSFTFEHNAMGREITRHLNQAFTLRHGYDRAGLLTRQTLTTTGTTEPTLERDYTYRPDGTPTAITDRRTGRRSFDLDRIGRVTRVEAADWTENYAYDAAGDQTHASWPDRHPHAEARGERTYEGTSLTRAGHLRYEHDAQGRVVLRQKTRLSRKPDTWRYTWDAEDHLTSVTTPDGTQWRYLYDPLGRRTAKQRLDTDGETVVEETVFTWDGTTLTEQTTQTPGTGEAITLTWDHDGPTPVSQTETKRLSKAPQDVIDQRFFAIVTDQIGTPTELIDDTGHVAWHTRTTLWGTTTWNRDATAYTPLRFPGQYYDPESELHHNYFRFYDPETARYLTLDPLGLDPAPNPLAYVDNPLRASDPLGLTPCDEADVTWNGRVRYGTPGPGGRATTMRARIEPGMTGGKTNPQAKVPGYEKYKKLNKTHLLGAQIGGSNKDPRNFVTMHRFANSPVMRKIEDQIRAAVDSGETIQYSVSPVYATNDPTDVVPKGLIIHATGNRGFQFTPYEGGAPTNHITILNVPKR